MILALTKSEKNASYYFDMRKELVRNKWTQIAFRQTEKSFTVFLDGASHFDIKDFPIINETNCHENHDLDESDHRMQNIQY